MPNWRPPVGHPAHPDTVKKAREFRAQSVADQDQIGAQKAVQAEHYIQQANALKWEKYGDDLVRELDALSSMVRDHKDNTVVCVSCQDRATLARALLNRVRLGK